MASIAVIGGAGYVGLTYAAALADLGHDVVAVDVDHDKVRLLSDGRAPIYEPGLEPMLRRGLATGRLRFSPNYEDAVPTAEFVFICVGTPPDAAGRSDMGFVKAAARAVASHARGHTIIVNKSTMPVGSVQTVANILAEHAAVGASFAVVANPEFLREGSAIRDVFQPSRIVLGAEDRAAAARVAELYAPLGAPVVITDPRSAEMIKYASNAFLATKISFINDIAAMCDRLGADVTEVARGMGLDDRIGARFLGAGAGFGGSCFPKDVSALRAMAAEIGLETTILDAVLAINEAARHRISERVAACLGGLDGTTVAVLGLSFKPDTDDVREAPALAVIAELHAAGARVRATDPVAIAAAAAVAPAPLFFDDPYAAATGADAVVLMTEWAEYRNLDLDHLANAMRGSLVVDGRNALDPAAVVRAGLTYVGVGRPIQTPTPIVRIERLTVPELTIGAAD